MPDILSELEQNIVIALKSTNSLRNEVERKENEKFDQLKDISLGIIDILDSFERIEEGFVEKGINKSAEAGKIITRYTTVQKRLHNLLQKYGITKIEFPDNRLIVGWCEVTETEPDSGRNNDEIISIVRNGYIRGKVLIRAAQIVAVKN